MLTRLTGLYLHNNSLSGRIPDIRLSKLKHLNISYNNLKGRIPSSFKAFPSSSFIGNPLLCGKPLKSCRHTLFKKKFSVWAVAAMAFVTLLLVVAFVFGCLRKKSSDERTEKPKEEFSSGPYPPEHNKLVFFEGSSYNFNLDDLLSASAEQLELIRSVGKHQNVATLHAFYYSTDEKLLLYDYYAAGSLMALLHDQDMEARITDIGLIPIMNIPLIPSSHSSGYQAPEVLETKVHTHKSDIYSFGILLLEILTGKKPFQSPSGGEMVDLLVWVQKVVKEEWTTDVFDVELMRSPKLDNEMIQMLQIALACVEKVPDRRLSITEVVGRIELIQEYDSDNGSVSD
ncbi:probable inactive receptor kinase [Tanacetum coccineum]